MIRSTCMMSALRPSIVRPTWPVVKMTRRSVNRRNAELSATRVAGNRVEQQHGIQRGLHESTEAITLIGTRIGSAGAIQNTGAFR
ncbi:MAG: hypothetical protein AAGG11_03065 [Pseudomonadota bacterium]